MVFWLGLLGLGALGVALRYLIGGFWLWSLPLGLWLVNTVGCYGIGLLYASPAGLMPAQWKTLLTVGLLGGLTTYSSYILTAAILAERGEWGMALLHGFASHALGFLALYLGFLSARHWL